MKKDIKKGKIYRLYSVSFTLKMGGTVNGPYVTYMAIPKLMPMPALLEVVSMLKKAGYIDLEPSVTAISHLGDFRHDDLPHRGCIVLERDGHYESPEPATFEKEDVGPLMLRMDWKV